MSAVFPIPSVACEYDRDLTIAAARNLVVAHLTLYGQARIGQDFDRGTLADMVVPVLAGMLTPHGMNDTFAVDAAMEAVEVALEVQIND